MKNLSAKNDLVVVVIVVVVVVVVVDNVSLNSSRRISRAHLLVFLTNLNFQVHLYAGNKDFDFLNK